MRIDNSSTEKHSFISLYYFCLVDVVDECNTENWTKSTSLVGQYNMFCRVEKS